MCAGGRKVWRRGGCVRFAGGKLPGHRLAGAGELHDWPGGGARRTARPRNGGSGGDARGVGHRADYGGSYRAAAGMERQGRIEGVFRRGSAEELPRVSEGGGGVGREGAGGPMTARLGGFAALSASPPK